MFRRGAPAISPNRAQRYMKVAKKNAIGAKDMNANRRAVMTAMIVTVLPARLTAASASAVTIFEAAKIITMEPSLPSARFVAVADGIILGLAESVAALEPWTRGRVFTVDKRFAKNVLIPGLIDPHVHPMQAAVMLNLPFIAPEDWHLPSGIYQGAQTPETYRSRLTEELAKSEADPFICWGHHQLFHGPIDRTELDRIMPDRAVIIWQRSFHEVIVNSAALKAWGLGDEAAFDAAVAAAKADPEHANFAQGVFSETALPIALEKLRPTIITPQKIRNGMAAMQKMMLSSGVTTISDMGTGIFAGFEIEAQLMKAAFERSGNPSRVMLMPMANLLANEIDLDAWLSGVAQRYASPHLRVDRRIKMFADGAFFAQSMRMKAPGYSDGHSGKWITPPDVADAQFKRFWGAGFDLHIHVNGDEGLDVVLDSLAALPVKRGQTITLEHLGFSTEAQNRRIAQMGLMVSAQPNYIRVLGDAYAKEGLGPDRAATMNRLGSLERKGVPLGLHSDFNMAPIDPLYLAWVAATRVTISGNLKAPAERLSLDKALRAITIEAAQVIGMDELVGSIAAGKKADFAVLDRDPYEAGVARLRELKVKGVIYEGAWNPA
jgi:predicted amidohydrolase YtcJ